MLNAKEYRRRKKLGLSLFDDNETGNNKKSRGLGDTVAKMTSAVGIKSCGECKKRQKFLNEKVPYRK